MDDLSSVGASALPLVMTAIHAGHELRPELAARTRLDDATRRREEDPFTERITAAGDTPVVVHRSRFEVDLNRPREAAVYTTPGTCWGLDIWREPLTEDQAEASLALHDAFYDDLAGLLDDLARQGPFVVLDVHSYNHRRGGADEPPAPAADNPEVNVGTGSVDDDLFGPLVERFMGDIRRTSSGSGPLDARENVAFEGRNLAWWVHDRYPRVGCVLALEFKKTFMDEWSGELDEARLRAAQDALASTLPGLRVELEKLR